MSAAVCALRLLIRSAIRKMLWVSGSSKLRGIRLRLVMQQANKELLWDVIGKVYVVEQGARMQAAAEARKARPRMDGNAFSLGGAASVHRVSNFSTHAHMRLNGQPPRDMCVYFTHDT